MKTLLATLIALSALAAVAPANAGVQTPIPSFDGPAFGPSDVKGSDGPAFGPSDVRSFEGPAFFVRNTRAVDGRIRSSMGGGNQR